MKTLIALRTCFLAVVLTVIQAPDSVADTALLAAACSGCHSKTTTEDGFPQIYGRPAAEIRETLLAFKKDEREATVMNRIAKGYSDDEIATLAAYLAAQTPANEHVEP